MLDGRDVNLVQIERGLAWFYRDYRRELSEQDRGLYESAERNAQANRLGLWQDRAPMPPRSWRRERR